MRERPILFSGPMVRAILEGRKSQTRRVLTRSNSTVDGYSWAEEFWDDLDFSDGPWKDGNPNGPGGFGCGQYLHVPRRSDDTFHRVRSRWEPGDRLWVRETWAIDNCGNRVSLSAEAWPEGFPINRVIYAADTEIGSWSKRPSIHMPRWASRLTLEVTGVRVERLREISEEDARAEGYVSRDGFLRGEWAQKYSAGNPWVWVIEFRRIET